MSWINKKPLPKEAQTANVDAEEVNEAVEKQEDIDEKNKVIENQEDVGEENKVEEKSEELEKYLATLSFEPVEMTMGETFQIELQQEILNAEWKSSNEDVVQVTEGQLKAIAPGNTMVTLSVDSEEVSFEVTVNAFTDMTLAVNCSVALEMNDAISNVRWESSAPEIVSVNEGIISSLGTGAANITAYIDEVPYSFEVVATTPDITTTSVRKIIGNTEQVSILGTNGKVEWKSDNTAIATVSDTGLITAEGTGAGQSTVVHACVDGMEFKVDVAVEPIPQLSSTYKIYGHQDDSTYKNANISICTNANKIVTYTYNEVQALTPWWSLDTQVKEVLNVADADYSDGNTYPLYYSFYSDNYDSDNYTDVYLVGTSQSADVTVQGVTSKDSSNPDGLKDVDTVVTYEPYENYGIIHIYNLNHTDDQLITVSVDGYQYQFVVLSLPYGSWGGRFAYDKVGEIPANYMVEECSVDEVIVSSDRNYSSVSANSKTYNPGTQWVERIGTKFVESLEDQAIDMAAGALLKFIFL